MTSRPAAAQHLDVEALARGAHMSAGHLSRQFRLACGESPYAYFRGRLLVETPSRSGVASRMMA